MYCSRAWPPVCCSCGARPIALLAAHLALQRTLAVVDGRVEVEVEASGVDPWCVSLSRSAQPSPRFALVAWNTLAPGARWLPGRWQQ